MTDVWSPLGAAGGVTVHDALTAAQFATLPLATPYQERAVLDVAGHRVELAWRASRELVATLVTDGERRDVASGRLEAQDSGSFAWSFHAMPLVVAGEPVTVERRRRDAVRWELRVEGPEGRRWTWRSAGLAWTGRMELVRAGERRALVTHQVHAGFAQVQPLEATWTAQASLGEVLMPVMWVLDRAYRGLLPKSQAIARGEVF